MDQDIKAKYVNPYTIVLAILVVFLNVAMFAK
jgi:hypothetical protein